MKALNASATDSDSGIDSVNVKRSFFLLIYPTYININR
jgi:hypothetical protein